MKRSLCAIVLSLMAAQVWAHSGSSSFIELNESAAGLDGEWLLALRDLEVAVGIDADQNGQLTWGEIQRRDAALVDYARANLHAGAASGDCNVNFGTSALVRLDNLAYLRLPLGIACPQNAAVNRLSYSALFAEDASHRAIVKWSAGDEGRSRVLVFSPQRQTIDVDAGASSYWSDSAEMIRQGVIHILEGYDHLMFLLALLVPLVLRQPLKKSQAEQQPSSRLSITLLKTVTAFTLGHSVTLALATVWGISPPIAWVELFIAVTVVIAGLNIVIPMFREASWRVAGLFGLIHGFGFAAVLAELELNRAQLALSLFSFNVGVELGQLAVVALACPVLLLFARSYWSSLLARSGAALTTVLIGTLWVAQRGLA